MVQLSMDSQRARNALFPENSGNPLVLLTLLAAVCANRSLLQFPGSPLEDFLPCYTLMMAQMQLLVTEAYGAMGQGEATFVAPNMPDQATFQRDVDRLRQEFREAGPHMASWHLSLEDRVAERHHLQLWSAISTLDEMEYFDTFPPLQMAKSGLELLMAAMEAARPIGARSLRPGESAHSETGAS